MKPFRRYPRLRRVALFAVLGCLAFELCYVLGINAFFSSPLAPMLMNLRPNLVFVTFDRAWSLWPWRIHARNAVIRIDDGRVQVQVTADAAQIDVHPLALLGGMFSGSHVHGHGISLRIRRYLQSEGTEAKVAPLPPIAGLSPRPPVRGGPFASPYEMLRVRLSDLVATEVREIWVDEYRFVGDADISGALTLQPYRAVAAKKIEVVIRSGAINLGAAAFAETLSGTLGLSLDEIDLRTLNRGNLRGLDCAVDLKADIHDVSFLNYYLRRVPQVSLDGGEGQIALTVIVERGRPRAGSKLALEGKRFAVSFPLFTAVGAGRVTWNASESRAVMQLDIGPFAFVQRADDKAYIKGALLSMHAVTTNLDLAEPIDITLKISLPDAHADDLRFVNRYFPDDSDFAILSGSGSVRGNFLLSSADQHASGALDVDSDKLAFRNKTAVISGRLAVRAKLVNLNLLTNETDLSGSSISVTELNSASPHQRDKHYWAFVRADELHIHPKQATVMRSSISVVLKNMSPVIDIIAARLPVPWILQRLLNLDDVHINTEVDYGAKFLTLKNIKVDAPPLLAVGRVALNDVWNGTQKARQRADARMLIKFGAISVGLSVIDARSKVHLVAAEQWYATPPVN